LSISQHYFRREHQRFLVLELLIFVVLAAMALWPMLNAAAMIQSFVL
jgi:hypothetical protein